MALNIDQFGYSSQLQVFNTKSGAYSEVSPWGGAFFLVKVGGGGVEPPKPSLSTPLSQIRMVVNLKYIRRSGEH